jgi:hypothetical protein
MLDGLRLVVRVPSFSMLQPLRYRNNTITSLDSEDGRMVTDHIEKVVMIWEEFRKRLSCSIHSKLQFNLADLIQQRSL